MPNNVQDFLNYEISEMHKNIDRIKHNLNEQNISSTQISGQRALLAIQNEHLTLIKQAQTQVQNYDDLSRICHQMVVENEKSHKKIGLRENGTHRRHSAEWWHSLHLIQFWSDFLNRCDKWQNR